jgi:hypothetical protein
MEEIKKEENPEDKHFWPMVGFLVLGGFLGAWLWNDYKSINIQDWLEANQDKLYCGHGYQREPQYGTKCWVVREFKHPSLEKILIDERNKKASVWSGMLKGEKKK